MRKYLLLLLFISSFLNADYLLLAKSNNGKGNASKCIKYYDFTDKWLFYKTSKEPNKWYGMELSKVESFDVQSGYYFDDADNDTCKKVTQHLSDFDQDVTLSIDAHNLSYLGLSDYDLNLMFAISGIIASTLFITAIIRFI